jgi:hypothetical protein
MRRYRLALVLVVAAGLAAAAGGFRATSPAVEAAQQPAGMADDVADNTMPVYGSVDPKSQRAAWSIGEKKEIVFEAGLNNLTQNETTLLVHYGKVRTQQMMLVRLGEPKDGK